MAVCFSISCCLVSCDGEGSRCCYKITIRVKPKNGKAITETTYIWATSDEAAAKAKSAKNSLVRQGYSTSAVTVSHSKSSRGKSECY